MQKTFFSLRKGDKIKVGRKWQTVRGKSIGRDWCAVRTIEGGLVEASKNQVFEVAK